MLPLLEPSGADSKGRAPPVLWWSYLQSSLQSIHLYSWHSPGYSLLTEHHPSGHDLTSLGHLPHLGKVRAYYIQATLYALSQG